MKKLKYAAILAATLCICSFTAFSSLSYLTDGGSHVNKFTTAMLEVDLTEPNWDNNDSDGDGIPNSGQDLHQGENRAKDPTVTNQSTIPSWVFLKVTMPTYSGRYADTKQYQNFRELFTYSVSSDWKLLRADVSTGVDGSSRMSSNTYIYGYNQKLAPGAKTTPLFSEVTFAPLVEGELADTTAVAMNVDAYGIQAMGVPNLDTAFNVFDWNQSSMSVSPDNSNRE